MVDGTYDAGLAAGRAFADTHREAGVVPPDIAAHITDPADTWGRGWIAGYRAAAIARRLATGDVLVESRSGDAGFIDAWLPAGSEN